MRTFFLIWSGQLVSTLGTSLTGFGLAVWVYQSNQSVTQFAMTFLCYTLPGMLTSPFTGVYIDRWNRRRTLILADLGAALGTLCLLVLLHRDSLALWHILLVSSLGSMFNAAQVPAYMAAVTQLVPKEHYARASGMVSLAESSGQLISPLVAALLLSSMGLKGILLLDLLSFLVGLATLLGARIPEVARTTPTEEKPSILREIKDGTTYIFKQSLFISLLFFFAVINFMTGAVTLLATPLILSFASLPVLGVLHSVCGVGMLLGSILMSTWGGPKNLLRGMLFFQVVAALGIIVAGLVAHLVPVAIGGFLFFFCVPLNMGCSQAIWQRKVPQELQGRVFSIRRLVAISTVPIAYLLAGPLADLVFEPLLLEGGLLAPTLGKLLGVGPGRGIGLMFLIAGALCLITTLLFFLRLPAMEAALNDEAVDVPAEVPDLCRQAS